MCPVIRPVSIYVSEWYKGSIVSSCASVDMTIFCFCYPDASSFLYLGTIVISDVSSLNNRRGDVLSMIRCKSERRLLIANTRYSIGYPLPTVPALEESSVPGYSKYRPAVIALVGLDDEERSDRNIIPGERLHRSYDTLMKKQDRALKHKLR